MSELVLRMPFLTRYQDPSYPALLKTYDGDEITNFVLCKQQYRTVGLEIFK